MTSRQVFARRMSRLTPRHTLALVAAIYTLWFGFALSPALQSGFVLVDDHEILSYAPSTQTNPALARPADFLGRITADTALGRFRPYYWVERLSLVAAFGDNPTAWHLWVATTGLVTAIFAFATLRGLGIPLPVAFLAGASVVVTPALHWSWIRMGTQETLGACWVTITAWAAVRSAQSRARFRWEILTVLAGTILALSKEPYILLLPAIAGLKLFAAYEQRGWPGLRSRRQLVTAAILLLVALVSGLTVLAVASAAGTRTYGGRYLGAINQSVWLDLVAAQIVTLTGLIGIVGTLVVPGLVPLSARGRVKKKEAVHWAASFFLLALFVAPQVLVHARADMLPGRYLMPQALGPIAAVAAAVAWFWHRRVWPPVVVALALWAWMLAVGTWATWLEANAFRVDSKLLRRAVDVMAAAPPGSTVVIASDPARTPEKTMSLLYHVAHRGRDDLDVRLVPVVATPRTPEQQLQAIGFAQHYFPNHTGAPTTTCDRLAVAFLWVSAQTVTDTLPCLAPPRYERVTLSEPVLRWSAWPILLLPTFTHTDIPYELLVARETNR